MRMFQSLASCFFLYLLFLCPLQAQITGGAYSTGIDKLSKGDYYGSISDFTKVIEQYPNEPKPYYYRAVSKFNLRDYAGAIVDLDKAIMLNPKYAEAFYMRGMSKVGVKKKKESCPDFQKANELGNPSAADALNKYCR